MTGSVEPGIRVADPADEAVLRQLDLEARAEGRRHRGSSHLFAELGVFSTRWISHGSTFQFVVAEVDGEVVGFTATRLQERPLLDQVFVHPQARGLGIGAALLKDAVRRHGADRLDALSLPGDRLTKNLYERAGLKARLIVASALEKSTD